MRISDWSSDVCSWGDRFTEMAESDPKSVVLVIADMARSQPRHSSAFVAEIVRRLQGQGVALALPLTWLEQWLADQEQDIAQMVQLRSEEHTSELQSLMRITYALFCLKHKTT